MENLILLIFKYCTLYFFLYFKEFTIYKYEYEKKIKLIFSCLILYNIDKFELIQLENLDMYKFIYYI